MASSKGISPPFGLKNPAENNFGALGRLIVERADERIRKSRSKALIWLVPSLLFYLVFAAVVKLVFWTAGIEIPGYAYLGAVAAFFLLMALLGQHYRMEGRFHDIYESMGRLHAILLVQAYLVKIVTAFFFIVPYYIVKNTAHLFPRPAKVTPPVLSVAVQTAAALDGSITCAKLRSLVPRELSDDQIEEALLLLKWSGLVETASGGGSTILMPSDDWDGVVSSLPPGTEMTTFSELTERARAVPQADEEEFGVREEPAGELEAPAWVDALFEHPVRNGLILIAAASLLIAVYIGIKSWYGNLPASITEAALPFIEEVDSFTENGGMYYAGMGDSVEEVNTSDWSSYTYSLSGLSKLWGRERGIENAEPSTYGTKVSFDEIYYADPDPGGNYLLVYGEWDCDPGPVSGGGTDLVIVDVVEGGFYMCILFDYLPVKGWWEEGKLLTVKPARVWEKGGGSRLYSDNLSGSMMALDVETGRTTVLYTPKEEYFGLAGRENGTPVFLAADREKKNSYGKTEFNFSEYRGFKKVNSFSFEVEGNYPVIRQAELDGTGEFWILVIEFEPTIAQLKKGGTSSLWVVKRNGGRLKEVTERLHDDYYLIRTFTADGNSMITALFDSHPPLFKYLQLNVD